MKWIAVVLLAIVLAGCGTIGNVVLHGSIDQVVAVTTIPPGATVSFSNGKSCMSPCTMTARRDEVLQISVSKPGCRTEKAAAGPYTAWGGSA